MSRLFKAHLAILTANIIFGLNFVIAKGIMPDYMLPLAIIFVRVLGTAALFWLIGLFLPREKVTGRDLIILAVCALFGVALNQILFFEGLNLTSPIDASIIITIIPITVLVFAHYMIHEKVTVNKLIGILMGAAGAIMVILTAGKISLSSSTFLGNLMVFINACSYGFYLVLVKPLIERYETVTIMKWLFFFGFIWVAPFSFRTFSLTDFAHIPPMIWGSILFVIFATTAIAYWLNNYSLKTVSPTVNGIYIYLQPVIASAVSVMMGKDHIEGIEVIASALIITGVYLVSRRVPITDTFRRN